MADQTQPPATGLTIPPDVQQKFATIVELIKASESMNNEERQYWINILPVMTAEQIKNLEDILTSEKQQLAAIDAKYNQQTTSPTQRPMEEVEAERRKQRKNRSDAELQHETQDQNAEEDILKQINTL